MQEITHYRTLLERQKGQKQQIESSLSNLKIELKRKKRQLYWHEQAREVVRTVGLATQEQISFHISDITSLALEAVFQDDAYELQVEFVQRRNKTECDLYFVRDGMKVNPLTASGIGAVDIATFALRIASWSMTFPRTRNTIILDEPFRCLSANYQELASSMLKEISNKLGIQFIVVTHNEALMASADRVFNVSIKNGKTIVK